MKFKIYHACCYELYAHLLFGLSVGLGENTLQITCRSYKLLQKIEHDRFYLFVVT